MTTRFFGFKIEIAFWQKHSTVAVGAARKGRTYRDKAHVPRSPRGPQETQKTQELI